MDRITYKSEQEIFNDEVLTRFELYNSMFLTLPFYKVQDTGNMLPLFIKRCRQGVDSGMAPKEIVEGFFSQFSEGDGSTQIIAELFRFIQYVERQVVLFDALEDAAFDKLHGNGHDDGLHSLQDKMAAADGANAGRLQDLLDAFCLRLVLTAHPTQFYPGDVLLIIADLTQAVKRNDLNEVKLLLAQLGKTPFFNREKVTPYDEAVNLTWYLEHIFYDALGIINANLGAAAEALKLQPRNVTELGFWPGGDRDGNPNVDAEQTVKVARLLRRVLYRCYYRELRELKRRLTFKGVKAAIDGMQAIIYKNAFIQQGDLKDDSVELLKLIAEVEDVLRSEHGGLFADRVAGFRNQVKMFGSYFATLDIRQDSRVLRRVHAYCLAQTGRKLPEDMPEAERIAALEFKQGGVRVTDDAEPLVRDALQTIRVIKHIQTENGEQACNRFIISNCQRASDILQLAELFMLCGFDGELTMDFVPLFETVDDLEACAEVMRTLFSHNFYKAHLARRGNKQDVMFGFSDGTKDGGFLMANWSIFKAKVELTAVAAEYGVKLAFFDGRGGPPARGGGKTYKFYAGMGREVANKNIQLTIQGQTISSQYGSVASAIFNTGQLLNAGLTANIEQKHNVLLDKDNFTLVERLAHVSHERYVALREDARFLPYMLRYSPLRLLGKINNSSRPVKRNAGKAMELSDLRAISFVNSWSQLKQNVPGFYGIGTALKAEEEAGNWEKLRDTYNASDYFKTIIENCMMSMSKADFKVTAFIADDAEYGDFWRMLRDEYELSREMLLKLTGASELMDHSPVDKASIAVREQVVLPLVVIQRYALEMLAKGGQSPEETEALESLCLRTVYGIVNAGRNTA